MWDHPEFDEVEDDWEPLRNRRAGPIRVLAILVVIAMVMALVVPALVRVFQDDEPVESPSDGVRVALVVDDSPPAG